MHKEHTSGPLGYSVKDVAVRWLTVFPRMGGPAAWKEMQKKKSEWSSEGFGVDEARINGDGDCDDEERDRYQDVDGDKLKDTDETSDEDVRPTHPHSSILAALRKNTRLKVQCRGLLWI